MSDELTPVKREKTIDELHAEFGDPYATAAYRSNTNLVPFNFHAVANEELFRAYIREIYRCRRDPIYFANNYYYIISPAKGKHIIETYPRQEEMLKCFIDNNRAVVLAARQTGKCLNKSTLIKVKNKITGEEMEISIADLIEKLSE